METQIDFDFPELTPEQQAQHEQFDAERAGMPPTEAAPVTRRLPLRAMPWDVLQREYWSKGRTYNDLRGRGRPRPTQHPIERQSWGELARTQYDEPESESRKAFYQTGSGALSLDALTVQHDASRYGVPYDLGDPETQAQIEWEQRAWHSGPLTIAWRGPDGRVRTNRYTDRATYVRLRNRLESMEPTGRHYDLTRDALRVARARAWWWLRRAEREHAELAPLDWHHPVERPRDPMATELGFDLCSDAELESWLGTDSDLTPEGDGDA